MQKSPRGYWALLHPLFFVGEKTMQSNKLIDLLEECPVIAAIQDAQWSAAIASPAKIIFCLKANVLTIAQHIKDARDADKKVLVHLDLAEGIGKDKAGVEYLAACGVDGIITTRGNLVRNAKEMGLITVQRFFALDSQGVAGIDDLVRSSNPDFIEIMPGVIEKIITRFSDGTIPVIAGGLIETKAEVTAALSCGAVAVSTGRKDMWYL